MGRAPCCDNVGLKKGPWTAEEDQKLLAYIKDHGHGSWRSLPAKAGLLRCGKSCRLRWTNYLRSDIKRGKFSLQEEQTIIQFHALLGNRWSAIAAHLPQRTDNEIKNYWNTHLKKRLEKMGIDPVTHKRKCESLRMTNGQQSKSASALSHMAQWESARLEAEARLARESKLRTGRLSGPLTNGGAVGTYAIANAGKMPNTSRSFSPFYSSTGTHLDVMKLKSLLFRTKRHPNTSSAVGPMSADQPENQQQAFALTDSLAESPTSTLSFAEMNNYPDQKPAQQEVVCRSLIEPADTTMAARRDDVQSSILDDNSLLLPNFHDVMFPCSDGNCSSARSFSEERSAIELSEADGAKTLDEISSSAEFNAEDHYGFLTDLLSDLSCFPHSGSENEHAVIMSNAENRDYWSSILDMVNSPQPHNSCVQSIF